MNLRSGSLNGLAKLVGGADVLLAKAHEAMTADDPVGAAQLAQHVVRLRPNDPETKLLTADALAVVGERTFNAPARNYTISYANRLIEQAAETNNNIPGTSDN